MSYVAIICCLACFSNATTVLESPPGITDRIPKELLPSVLQFARDYERFRLVIDSLSIGPSRVLFERLLQRLQRRGLHESREAALEDLWKFNSDEFRELFKRFEVSQPTHGTALRANFREILRNYVESPPLWKYLPRIDRVNYSQMFVGGPKYSPGLIPEMMRDFDGTSFHPYSFERLGDKVISVPSSSSFVTHYIDLSTGESVYHPRTVEYKLFWSPSDRCTVKVFFNAWNFQFVIFQGGDRRGTFNVPAASSVKLLRNVGDGDHMYIELDAESRGSDARVASIAKKIGKGELFQLVSREDVPQGTLNSNQLWFFFARTIPLLHRLFLKPIFIASTLPSLLTANGLCQRIRQRDMVSAALLGMLIGRSLVLKLKSSTRPIFTWNFIAVFALRLLVANCMFWRSG